MKRNPVAAREVRAPLPDLGAVRGGEPHGVAGLDGEGFVEGGLVDEGADGAELARRVGADDELAAQGVVAVGGAPALGPGDEETLLGRVTVDEGRARTGGEGALQGLEGDRDAAEVGDVFTLGEGAVDEETGQALVGVELVDEDLGADGEFGGVGFGPPIAEVAGGVVAAALVVEAVDDLVADDGADHAVVDGVVGVEVEEGWLEDAGGENDLVGGGLEVGVDGGRGHGPLGFIHFLAEAVEAAAGFVVIGGAAVAKVVGAGDGDGGDIAPRIRMADTGDEAVELGEGLGAGGGRHPGEVGEAVAHDGFDVVDHGGHAGGGLGRVVARDVELAEGLAEGVVGGAHGAFPAGFLFGDAVEGGAVEAEVFGGEGGGEAGRGRTQKAMAEVAAPVGEGALVEEGVEAGEELGLADDDVGEVGEIEAGGGDQIGDGEGSEEGGEVGQGIAVVVGDAVAELHRGAHVGGEGGLEVKDEGSLGGSGGGVVTGELKEAGEMSDKLGADGGELIGEVVVAAREAETALGEGEGVEIALAGVGADPEPEEAGQALAAPRADEASEGSGGIDGGEFGEVGFDGGEADGLEGGFVEGGGVEVADLALEGAGGRVTGCGGFEKGAEVIEVTLGEGVEGAVTGLIGGHLESVIPRAGGEAGEVVARIDGEIHVAEGEALGGGAGGGRGGCVAEGGGEKEREEDEKREGVTHG